MAVLFAYDVDDVLECIDDADLERAILLLRMRGGEELNLAIRPAHLARLFSSTLGIIARSSVALRDTSKPAEPGKIVRATTVGLGAHDDLITINFLHGDGTAHALRIPLRRAITLIRQLETAHKDWSVGRGN